MSHYKLVASGRPEVQADEIILKRDELTGEPTHTLSLRRARQIPEELLDEARGIAGKLGFAVVEADAPEDEEEETQPVGDDVAGQAKVGEGASAGGGDQAGSGSSATTTGASAGTSAPTPAQSAGASGVTGS